jgi:dTDP-4-amino-4,6-dideoxygalactose transaminase
MSFNKITEFENKVAKFFGSPYAVAVDCCTHGVELCLRYKNIRKITVPKRTYISIPFLASKLNIDLEWKDEVWTNYYYLTDNIIDAAVLWEKNSYIPNTFMSVSFQFRKHLALGRGGIILTDDKNAAMELKKMSYDGRHPDIPWREQNINTMGYHYYMTPETAELGLEKIDKAIDTIPKQWVVTDWPDLTQMEVFTSKIEGINPYLQTK